MHEQIYACLLRLYPRRFRDEYAEEAVALFSDRLNDERGLGARVRLWLDILADLGVSLWREHRRPATAAPMPATAHGDTSGAPHLHLFKEGLPLRHLSYGAFFSIFVFGTLSLALMQGGRGGNANLPSAEGGRDSAPADTQRFTDIPQGSSIAGSVRVASTGAPVTDAWIAVSALANDGTQPPAPATPPLQDASTNSAGEFQIRDLSPGSYRLIVMADGYVRQEYSRTLTVAPGQDIRNLAVLMTPAATISGRIHGAAGQPLAGVTVTLFRRAYSSTGMPTLRRIASKRSNDLGEYRFYWLTPGRYVVSAEGPTGGVLAADPVSVYEQNVSLGINEVRGYYPQQFYPGTPDEERAMLIEAPAGYEVRGIDFTMTGAKGFRISGRVIDGRTGQPPPQMSINGLGGVRYYRDTKTGTFEFANILPGVYRLTATASLTLAPISPNSSEPVARATVVVADADVDGVILSIFQPPLIEGTLRVEGAVASSTPINPLRFTLVPRSREGRSGSISSIAVSTKADGTFLIGGMEEGEFRVSMPSLPAGFYLKEARLDGADMLHGFASIASPGKLELVISSSGGSVDGIVVDEQGRAFPGAQAVLVPDQRERTDLFKRVLSDANGRFSISGIAPGTYRVFAWADLEDYAYFDPAVVERYAGQARALRIEESSRQAVELKAIEGAQP